MEVTSGSVLSQASGPRRFALAITAVFLVIALIGILNHEMWRDELHCWLVARDAHSAAQLYSNVRYDGHPIVWYALLYVLTRFTINPLAMQMLILALAAIAVYLFNRFSSFSILQKILFSFGYYSLYEYSIIARSYSFGFFLVILFCSLYKHRKVPWLFLVLILLANTSAFGLALSVCFAGILLMDWLVNRKRFEWANLSFWLGAGGFTIFVLGVIFSVIQILPEKENTLMHPHLTLLGDVGRMKLVLSKISEAYIPIPEIRSLPYWISDQSDRFVNNDVGLYVLFSIVLVIVATVVLMHKPLALLLFWLGTTEVICLLGLTNTLGPRHIGHLVMILLAALWLAEYFPERDFRSWLLISFSKWGRRIQNGFVLLLFASQMIAGIAIYTTDLEMKFSASKEAANFIREHNLRMLPIVGTPDWASEDFAALLNTRIYYPERREFGSFIIWDGKRTPNPSDQQIVDAIDAVLGQSQPQALLILNHPAVEKVADSQVTMDLNTVNPTIKLVFLAKFEEAMMFDEIYYIYLAQRVKS